jgi:DNA-binding YbaB/EbfC family protein
MKNLGNMLRQAQEMQGKMAEMQERLAEVEMSGSSGAGLVQVTLSGKSAMKKIKIDKSLLVSEEAEVLEDLVVAAYNDAKTRLDTYLAEEMQKLTGGLNLPGGFKLPF